ncbi:hypothetical protein FN846DRAFT_986117 [Sphaerosporella brunnea]|uniref:HTH CENPB-type domain-containing protein n=1 Tax=Sphaerosporella brunnea TaxID=1250544 RepID=A0A5J5ETY9_9PEZI|nr:hypothetical protein FN846DRAFT_986117 [Sphaerosporella brunnea]
MDAEEVLREVSEAESTAGEELPATELSSSPPHTPIAKQKTLPRDPEAMLNPTEHLELAHLQELNPNIEIVNPPPSQKHPRWYEHKEPAQTAKKRRTTTREDRIEALEFEHNARQWELNNDGPMLLSPYGVLCAHSAPGEMVLHPISRRYAAEILGYDESQLRKWSKEEEKILHGKKGGKRIGSGRKSQWPKMEERLAEMWRKRVHEGLETRRKWFDRHAIEIFEEEYPDEVRVVDGKKFYGCCFSDGWFNGFKSRHGVEIHPLQLLEE